MKLHPKVTIGLPVRNGDKYLQKALDSVVSQSYKNLELIISVNKSNDNTSKIADKFKKDKPWVKVFTHKRKLSLPENFLFVLKKSNGKYFMWLSHDDFISPEFICSSSDFLENNPNCCVVQGKTHLIQLSKKQKTNIISFFNNNTLITPKVVVKNLLSENKYNYFFYGLFRSEILKKGYNLCNVKSGDRFILLQYAILGFYFGFIKNVAYFRGIHHKSALQRYPDDKIEAYLAKQDLLLDFISIIKMNTLIWKNQKIEKINFFIKVKYVIKIFIFLLKRQIILLLRFVKYNLIKNYI